MPEAVTPLLPLPTLTAMPWAVYLVYLGVDLLGPMVTLCLIC
jgi:hypothetical protein